jgi:hypothetical protein
VAIASPAAKIASFGGSFGLNGDDITEQFKPTLEVGGSAGLVDLYPPVDACLRRH